MKLLGISLVLCRGCVVSDPLKGMWTLLVSMWGLFIGNLCSDRWFDR